MAIEAMGAMASVKSAAGSPGGSAMGLLPSGSMGGAHAPSSQMAVKFREAMGSAGGVSPIGNSQPSSMKTVFNTLDQVNNQAKSVSEYASAAEASGGQMTPGEIVQLTMRCNEFMFQCQLTSNIANRSSDGVSQLFRQQG
jgi:hypothetical protein